MSAPETPFTNLLRELRKRELAVMKAENDLYEFLVKRLKTTGNSADAEREASTLIAGFAKPTRPRVQTIFKR